jgi:hypothetical protein
MFQEDSAEQIRSEIQLYQELHFNLLRSNLEDNTLAGTEIRHCGSLMQLSLCVQYHRNALSLS